MEAELANLVNLLIARGLAGTVSAKELPDANQLDKQSRQSVFGLLVSRIIRRIVINDLERTDPMCL